LAALLGLATSYLIWAKFRDLEKSARTNWKPVVVARMDIQAREKITADKVDLTPVAPESLVPPM
jgi:hypothetical protein